ncbi:MAG: MdtA/MuxA family multidrug efflux RND transporter periplasmic adaptor subunit [Candidatus Binatus sp.]|uniref:MdtA/MuxA family multidrug efflux RND transporter periplasmic adaptor subunit n=1 Tax=Candidatus Binatus sp. TaxID=2811406 RepID=UPI003C781B1C
MDSDAPTTGKPNASRFVQDAEVPSLLDKVMQRWRMWLVVLAVAIIGIYYLTGRSSTDSAAMAPAVHPIIPVAAAPAKRGDLEQYISAIGTVTAYNTVTVKSRVDGQLDKVNFTEGQIVKAGDLLAEIDPRPYQVELTQAEGTLAKDLSNLENNKILLARDKELYEQKIIARQDLDNQQALVGQYAGSIESDKGAVDNAKLQLVYSRITSPITGRVGLRLVDPGNIIHATDATGLVVITQLQPIAVDFSIPEDDLPSLETAMKATPQLPVTAYDRDFKHQLAEGVLLTTDNQIDQSTGTIKLKASFPNLDNSLFPNQFVNAKLLINTIPNATLIPAAGLQRSQQGAFVYVIKPDFTVEMRPVTVQATQGEVIAISKGLQVGDLVVTDGVDKLQQGSRVSVQNAATPSTSASNGP